MSLNTMHEKTITHSSSRKQKDHDEIEQDIIRTGVALSANEVVSRYGGANAEFIKGYAGLDNETGQKFAKGLADIAKHKLNENPEEAVKNIKQQAGFSAEVVATSRDNAEAIINESELRTSRSDDLPQYGRNHNVVDRVQILNGEILEGTQTQMKFVGDRDQLFYEIAKTDGKFARYRGIKLEIPSEQFDGAQKFCRDKAAALHDQALVVEQHGKPEIAAKLRSEASNYDQLSDNIKDSGLTTEEAIFSREHPRTATAFDIGRVSHRAGIQGAKVGATIGLSISLLQNLFAVAQGKKETADVLKDVIFDTAKAGAIGYSTGFVGAAAKGGMQQSGLQTIRTLAGTSAPTLVVNVCLSLGSSVKRYVAGEIDETQLLVEVGEKGAGMLSSSMMAAIGQIAIPIPFVGAAIGGMIGYTVSSLFYQSALDAAVDAKASRKNLERVRAIEDAARIHIGEQQAQLDAFMCREIPELLQQTQQLFSLVNSAEHQNADTFAAGINQYATLLGKKLQFQSIAEFDDFMNSDKSFTF
jgi:hypothetical protein